MIAIGIDIGGTSIKGAAITEKGKVLEVFSLPVIAGDSQETTINNLIATVKKYIVEQGFKQEEILGIGLGVPGSIDSVRGYCDYSNNLKWSNLPIVKMFEKEFALPIKITNDANAAALGEAKFGAGRKFKNMILLTLGTGVGGGIIIDGKLYEGNAGKGAELGHTVTKMNGRKCTCGRKGCLEAYASATGLIFDTKQAMKKDNKSLMWKISKELGIIDARVAFEAAKQGDQTAQKVVDNYIMYLGEGLLNFFNIFRPEAVVLSGGIANQGEYLFGRLDAYCQERKYGFECTPAVKILGSELGYDSGKIGAAALFFQGDF
ncbi:MAG: ROK family protein [Bacilli bacterium]|jgi:glucokinase